MSDRGEACAGDVLSEHPLYDSRLRGLDDDLVAFWSRCASSHFNPAVGHRTVSVGAISCGVTAQKLSLEPTHRFGAEIAAVALVHDPAELDGQQIVLGLRIQAIRDSGHADSVKPKLLKLRLHSNVVSMKPGKVVDQEYVELGVCGGLHHRSQADAIATSTALGGVRKDQRGGNGDSASCGKLSAGADLVFDGLLTLVS